MNGIKHSLSQAPTRKIVKLYNQTRPENQMDWQIEEFDPRMKWAIKQGKSPRAIIKTQT